MLSYDGIARIVLKTLCQDLGIPEGDLWEEYLRIEKKYLYRPSSLILAIIERHHPDKRELIELTLNVTTQTINHTLNRLEC